MSSTSLHFFSFSFFFFSFFLIDFPRRRDNYNAGKQGKNCAQWGRRCCYSSSGPSNFHPGREKEVYVSFAEFVSSLEKAHGKAVAAFKKPNDHKKALDSHYAAGYEDFRANAKETYPELDFDSFKLPFATESSLLQTSSEDFNILDDANNEVTQDSSKSGRNASSGLPK